jgi:hypothetical protein
LQGYDLIYKKQRVCVIILSWRGLPIRAIAPEVTVYTDFTILAPRNSAL